MKRNWLIVILMMFYSGLFSQEIVVTGNQESEILYRLEQSIEPFDGIDILMVSFVVPKNFSSPTYAQTVSDIKFDFQPAPKEQEQETDARGNLVRKFYWDVPTQSVQCEVSLKTRNQVKLEPLQSEAKFPVENLAPSMKTFLANTEQVQVNNPAIKEKALQLTKGISNEFKAVQSILHFVVDHMRYVLVPEKYDALYALQSGRGNCQNYSHLSAALMRAVGIPVRIVNGITLKKPYDVKIGESEYSFEMAQGRHSWIEVYFSDIGWIPFDPQQTEFFVSNRYLRIEVGLDNQETVQDGLVRWSQTEGSEKRQPKLEEAIESDFISDRVALLSEKKLPGPRRLLLTPELLAITPPIAEIEPQEEPTPQPEPEVITEPEPKPKPPTQPEPEPEEEPEVPVDYRELTYELPFEYGNLEFPQRFDFVSSRLAEKSTGNQTNELRRNFIVETAEYVTGKSQFAQTFVLDEPIILQKIGLALHNFGGNGLLWLELSEDENGRPGPSAASSTKMPNNFIRIPTGYDWVDFDFSSEGLLLTPGRYWFTLKFSGSPIVNWFYTYGKPVGPVDGTRSKLLSRVKWDKVLSYEFNYRVIGKGAK